MTLGAQSQSVLLDSLRGQLSGSQGERRVDLLNAYGYVRLSYDYTEATRLIDEALALSKKINYKKGIAEALFYKGVIQLYVGVDSVSLRTFWEGLRVAADDPSLQGRIFTRIAEIYQNRDRLDSASKYYDKSYALLKDSLAPLPLSYLYLQMAEYCKIKNDQLGELNYLKRSWNIRKRLAAKHPLVWVGASLAAYYIERGDYSEARS